MRLLRLHRLCVRLVQGISDRFWLDTTRSSSVTLQRSLSMVYGHSRECNCGRFSYPNLRTHDVSEIEIAPVFRLN